MNSPPLYWTACTNAHQKERPVAKVDELITLIRDRRLDEALAMLDSFPELATLHSDQDGQLHGASPLHWAGHRNAVRVCASTFPTTAS